MISYSDMSSMASQSEWVNRIEVAIVHTATDVKTTNTPADALETRRDALGRAILANSAGYAKVFALPVALGFIGGTNLDEVSDAAIFSRVDAVWDDIMPAA